MARKTLRNSIIAGSGLALVALFVLALRPQTQLVDLSTLDRGPMQVLISEEARTRVRNPYLISAPISGRLLRVDIDPGDAVIGNETVVARLLPTPPTALDLRTREQAQALVSAAEAAIAVARADLTKARADQELADEQVKRVRTLRASNAISRSALDQAERESRAAAAATDVANAAIAMRTAELQSARVGLISFGETTQPSDSQRLNDRAIPIMAPVSGQVLRVLRESETPITAGDPILEVGNVATDLEILAELLSSDAVQVAVGDPVIISDWGRAGSLEGIVERVEPSGFTKFSALGVEEQRVNTLISFSGEAERRAGLGHGFRVTVGIVVWSAQDVLTVPTSALFRQGDQWAVFKAAAGVATAMPVRIGHNNGRQAEVLDGLAAGDSVVLYPAAELTDGQAVRQR